MPSGAHAPQGSLLSWGDSVVGSVVVAPQGTDFMRIAAGREHALATRVDGSLFSWGSDAFGLVTATPSGVGFVDVAAGRYHSVALRPDGSLVSWGDDSLGQVAQTPSDSGFVEIAAGSSHSLARRADGSVVSWGGDSDGQVSQTPTEDGFVEIAGGLAHSLARRSDGSLVSWGRESVIADTPTDLGHTAIGAGNLHSIAVRSDGSLAFWGSYSSADSTVDLPTGNDFVRVDGGQFHSVALRSDGSIASWGAIGTSFPQVIDSPLGTRFTDVSAGRLTSLASVDPCSGSIQRAASQVVRLGHPANEHAFFPAEVNGPALGKYWRPPIFAPSANDVRFLLISGARANIPLGDAGTLLCDPTSSIFSLEVYTSQQQIVDIGVAYNCSLLGLRLSTQAGWVDGRGSVTLTNALDVTVGTH